MEIESFVYQIEEEDLHQWILNSLRLVMSESKAANESLSAALHQERQLQRDLSHHLEGRVEEYERESELLTSRQMLKVDTQVRQFRDKNFSSYQLN